MNTSDDNKKTKKTFNCDRCQFKSYYNVNLNRHIAAIHENGRAPDILYCKEDNCEYRTTKRFNLNRHIYNKHRRKQIIHKCNLCSFETRNLRYYRKHLKVHNGESIPKHSCSVCRLCFDENEDFLNHLQETHPKDNDFEIVQSAFRKNIRIYQKIIRQRAADTSYLWQIFPNIVRLFKRILAEEFTVFTANFILYARYEKIGPENTPMESETFPSNANAFSIKPHTKLRKVMSSVMATLDDLIENKLLRGSGWHMVEIVVSHLIQTSK